MLMNILVALLLFVAILLFIVNIYFEVRNRQRISKIDQRIDRTLINMLETFKRWLDIKENVNDVYSKIGEELKTDKKEKRDDS